MKPAKGLLFKILIIVIYPSLILMGIFRKYFVKHKKMNVGLLNTEFFHKEIGIFGGYGMTARKITDYFNNDNAIFNFEVLMMRPTPDKTPTIKKLDNVNVICSGGDPLDPRLLNILKYAKLINNRRFDLLITMEFYALYLYSILLLPVTPVIFWIHDPRPKDEIDKIAAVPLVSTANELIGFNWDYEKKSLKKILKTGSLLGRKIIFATTANCLIKRAKRTYSLDNICPIFLPTPVELPPLEKISYSSKPSFLFLGRLDPIKRPWILFELAKKFPEINFLVAGKVNFPEIMNPIIQKYSNVPNLKFLGLVTGREKDELLKQSWATINTSIHEALPVSFLETLAYGKPIISCQNPDDMVSRFGVYTGEILGEGMNEQSIAAFSNAIEKLLVERNNWKKKGEMARNFIEEYYSFRKFENVIKEIV